MNDIVLAPGFFDLLSAECRWWATGDPDCESEPKKQTISGNETIITLEGKENLPDEIYAYNGTSFWGSDVIEYDWSYEIEGEDYDIDPKADENKHNLYVTLGAPAVTDVYETILYITCNSARGRRRQR